MGGLLKAELRKAQTCTIARVLVIVPFIVVFLALSALRVQGQDSTVQVVIESAILEPDFQPGMKSRHVVQVDFAGQKVIDVAETGVTELLGTQWNSIRDNFRVLDVSFNGDKASFVAKGETASAVQFLPNINYTFQITVWRDGTAVIRGCHDGYPGYRVTVEGEDQYFFAHEPKDLVRLVGECDIRLTEHVNGPDTALTITSTQILPDGAGTGAVIFEASSRHAAVRLFYEDPMKRRTSATVYAVTEIGSKDELPGYAVVRRVAEQALAGEGTLGRVLSQILRGSWGSLIQPQSLPGADLRFIVRADSAVVARLDAALASRLEPLGDTLDADSYDSVAAAMARLLFEAAVQAEDQRLMVPVNSAGDRMALPDPAVYASGLGWLLAYAYQSEGHAGLAGCQPETVQLLPRKGEGHTQVLANYLDLLSTIHEGRLTFVAAAAYYTGGAAIKLYANAVALEALKATWNTLRNDSYSAFLLLGNLDPARVQIARCKGLRMLRGPLDPIGLIVERSEIYRVASEAIKASRPDPHTRPLFFDAARAVTRLVGVGLVDLADDVDLDNETPAVAAARDLMSAGGCLAADDQLLPSARDRAFLRRVNAELLAFNQPRMRRLIEAPDRLFDPLGQGRLHPPEGMSPALFFDLRMVVAEQGRVEELIREEGILPGSNRDATLTAAEKAMRCLSFAAVRYALNLPAGGTPHLDLIAQVDAALETLVADKTIPAGEARFTSRHWRVAIGSAFVFALHRPQDVSAADWRAEYLEYMRQILVTMNADKRRNPNIPAGLQNRLDGIIANSKERWKPEQLEVLSRASTLFLAPASTVELYKCELNPRSLNRAHPFPNAVDRRERLNRLDRLGAGTLALPYELSSTGGALQRGLTLYGRPDASQFCEALDQRHAALICAVDPAAAPECRADGARLTQPDGTEHFILMETSLKLREDLGQLGPYLYRAFALLPDDAGEQTIAKAVGEAATAEADYSRNLALALAVSGQDRAVLQALGLEIDAEGLSNLIGRAQPQETKDAVLVRNGTVDAPALEAYAHANSLAAQAARIDGTETELAQLVGPILAAAGDASDSAAATRDPPSAPDHPVAGTHAAEDLLGAAALTPGETGVGFEMHEVESDPDGFARYRGVLVYRRATIGANGTICSPAGEGRTCVTTLSEQVPDPLAGGATTERLPLGLEIEGLTFETDGSLAILSTLGEADIALFPDQTRAALYALGMPRVIGLDNARFDVSADLTSLSLIVNLYSGGVQPFEVRVPIIRDSTFTDLPEEAKRAILEAVNARLRDHAEQLRLDTGVAPTPALPIGFQLVAEGLEPTVDWTGGSILAQATLELVVGIGPDALALQADAELLLSTSAASLRAISFRPFNDELLLDALERVEPFTQLRALAGDLVLRPDLVGNDLAILVQARPEIDGCVLPIEARLSLKDPKAGIEALAQDVSNAAAEAIICQARRQVDDLTTVLSQEELDLFGIRLTFDFDTLLQSGRLLSGRWPVPLSFVDGQFAGCDAPPDTLVIPNFGLELDTANNAFEIDLKELTPPERLAMGAAVRCRLLAAFAAPELVDVTNVEIGHNILAVDVTLSNLPFLGNFALPRLNVADFGDDPVELLIDSLKDASGAAVADRILAAIGPTVQVPGVGAFRPEAGGLLLDLFDERKITMTGTMSFADQYDLRVMLEIPMNPDLLSGFRITPLEDPAAVLGNQLVGYLTGLLPFPGNGVKLIAPRVAQLDDAGHRWGLVFGLTIDMDLGGQGFRIAIQRIAISLDGINMDQEIRMGLKVPIYLPPVALSQVIVIYHTGTDGGRKGLALGADLTAVEPQLADILKIESILDLRDIEQLRFVLAGKLIAFDSLSLLEASGTLDLGNQYADFEAATTEAIRAVINAAAEGKIDGPNGLIMARSELQVVGVDLQRDELHFCTKSCDPLFPDGGSARLSTAHKFLFGPSSDLKAQTDLEFRAPGLGAGVGLDLFGWEPGAARVDVNLRLARMELKFLGMQVGITVPTIELMTPGLIADVLKSLLDVRLEDLLRLPPQKIEFSLMKGDGSLQDSSSGRDGGGDAPGADAGDGSGDGRQPVKRGTAEGPGPAPTQPADIAEADGEEVATGPAQPFWGTRVTGIYCEKVASTAPNANPLAIGEGDRFELWGRTFSNADGAKSPLYSFHPHSWPSWHEPTFNAANAKVICEAKNNRTLQMSDAFANVGVARSPIGGRVSCEDNVPEYRYFRLQRENENHKPRFTNAQRSVLCYEVEGRRFNVEARLLMRTADKSYVAVIYCPEIPNDASAALAAMPGWSESCGSDRGAVELGTFGDEGSVISDITELRLIEDRLRGILVYGAPLDREYTELDTGTFLFGDTAVTFVQKPEFGHDGSEIAHRFEFSIPTGEAGISRVEFLRLAKPSDPTSGLWPWVQPNRAGIRDVILARWLETGVRPEVVTAWPDAGWLVLALRSERGREFQLWLRDNGTEPPGELTLDSPARAPNAVGAFSGDRRDAWLDGLRLLVERLPAASVKWTLSLGHASQSRLALYGFSSVTSDDLLVHMHRYPPETDDKPVWIGGAADPSRTVCGTETSLRERLAENARPDLRGEVSVADAIADPDRLSRTTGLREHAIGLLADLGECGG